MAVEVFRRTEKKYILTEEEFNIFFKEIEPHLEQDKFFSSSIRNIYFDTDNNDLIRSSIEKPLYKEKIRLRSYVTPTLNSKVYLEVKKKYKGVVSKRRVGMTLNDYYNYMNEGIIPNCNKQIFEELDYTIKRNNLKPKIYISYDRKAYYDKENESFRITFDHNIRYRYEDLRLEVGDGGKLVFRDNRYIVEAKALDAYPLWFIRALSKINKYSESFSKYGYIYENNIGKKEYNYV